ncbi:MAG: hypothetical protein RBR97_16550 [Bacteroidales bacterium]|nr:hypothetical protein [Bacteroidales bacterium]
MKQIIIIILLASLNILVYSQDYFIGVESGYGISSSRIEYSWYGSSIKPLAENCGKAGVTGKVIFENNLGMGFGINYLFIQSPDKIQNTGYSMTPELNEPRYLSNKHHYLNIPILCSYSIQYFRIEAGLYYSFLLVQKADMSVKSSDAGFLFKLNFDIYKGLYFYQETSFGLVNIVNLDNFSKKNYYLMLGLGYNLNLGN